ncbi:hypothetical protein LCGC14_2674510, partial [marine sediment metagenome]
TTAFDAPLVLAYGSGADPATTDGDFLQKLNITLPATARDFAAETGTMIDVTFKGADDLTNEMVDIETANAVDRSW